MNQSFAYEDEPVEPEVEKPTKAPEQPSDALALRLLKQIQESLGFVIRLLEQGNREDAEKQLVRLMAEKQQVARAMQEGGDSRILEGVFDGERMVGEDGNAYQVPPNYASKSRLVEGDRLKLTIGLDGRFLFKQIKPVERERLHGELLHDPVEDVYHGVVGKRTFRLLAASVSYYHGEPGDAVVLLVPKGRKSSWAAVENILKKG